MQQEKDVIIYYLASVVVSSNTYRANVLEALQFIQEAFAMLLKGTCIVNLPNIPLPIIMQTYALKNVDKLPYIINQFALSKQKSFLLIL